MIVNSRSDQRHEPLATKRAIMPDTEPQNQPTETEAHLAEPGVVIDLVLAKRVKRDKALVYDLLQATAGAAQDAALRAIFALIGSSATSTLEDRLLRYLLRYARPWQDVHVVSQKVITTVFSDVAQGKYKPERYALEVYVFLKARNICAEDRREEEREQKIARASISIDDEGNKPIVDTLAADSESTGSSFARWQIDAYWRAVYELKEELLDVWLLRRDGEFSLYAIAEILGVPYNTVRDREKAAERDIKRGLLNMQPPRNLK